MSAASKRPAIPPKTGNCDMSISTLNLALIALLALSLLPGSTTKVRVSRVGVDANEVAKS
jgi:hypothetical protein